MVKCMQRVEENNKPREGEGMIVYCGMGKKMYYPRPPKSKAQIAKDCKER